jgi:hypothetical protein
MKWYKEYFSELKVTAITSQGGTNLEDAERRKAYIQLKD